MKKIILSSVLAISLAVGAAQAMMGGGSSMGGSYGGDGYIGGNYGGDGHMGDSYGSGGYMNQGNGSSNGGQQRFSTEIAELSRLLNARQFDYQQARRNPNTRADELLRIERDIRDIMYKIDAIGNR